MGPGAFGPAALCAHLPRVASCVGDTCVLQSMIVDEVEESADFLMVASSGAAGGSWEDDDDGYTDICTSSDEEDTCLEAGTVAGSDQVAQLALLAPPQGRTIQNTY